MSREFRPVPVPVPEPARREPALVGYGAEQERTGRPRRRPRILPAVDDDDRDQRIRLDGVRRHTVRAMAAGALTAPHATVFLTVDVTSTMDLMRRRQHDPGFAGGLLTPLAFAARAVCLAIPGQPMVNSRWDGQGGGIVRRNYVNLGITVATDSGLVVPNIKDAHRLSLPELTAAANHLAVAARQGTATAAEFSGGTFTLTDVGSFGVDSGTPIINPGESATLAVGAVRMLPWVHRGEVTAREVMTLSLSFDHRIVDGEQGSRFLADVAGILAEPETVLVRY